MEFWDVPPMVLSALHRCSVAHVTGRVLCGSFIQWSARGRCSRFVHFTWAPCTSPRDDRGRCRDGCAARHFRVKSGAQTLPTGRASCKVLDWRPSFESAPVQSDSVRNNPHPKRTRSIHPPSPAHICFRDPRTSRCRPYDDP